MNVGTRTSRRYATICHVIAPPYVVELILTSETFHHICVAPYINRYIKWMIFGASRSTCCEEHDILVRGAKAQY